MLARLSNFENQVSLIEGSGIQFLDFGFCPAPKLLAEGNFIDGKASGFGLGEKEIPILLAIDAQGGLSLPNNRREKFSGTPTQFSTGIDSLRAFDAAWLPIPYFQMKTDGTFLPGPFNWARIRIKCLDQPDEFGNHIRITVAFDTNIQNVKTGVGYLTPTHTDIDSGKVFGLATDVALLDAFVLTPWVRKWIEREWGGGLKTSRGTPLGEEQKEELRAEWPGAALGKYIHAMSLLAHEVKLPRIKILGNSYRGGNPVVEANLILDIGNSRTCAVVLEKHPDQRGNLANSYTLELRDLGESHLVYSEPFESRVEFTQVEFGSGALSRESGRYDAFSWATFIRVGPEAARLASRRRGTEGATGLASPKRYLWDEASFPLDWRFNQPGSRSIEPLANEGVFVTLVNESGDALCDLDQNDPNRFPVINPRYSRSSMMTFAIAEILSQALGLINSPAQRLRMPNYDLARNLTKIVLTLPPAMPLQEQAILKKRASQACKLVWQALGHLDEEGKHIGNGHPPLPEVIIRYDEATCGQVVWLYSMITHQFGGSAPAMFQSIRRHFGDAAVRDETTLRVASIDIGGGTTDLVIADYCLEGKGTNVTIVPEQVFREGFSIAGDDILKRIIQVHVIGAIEEELRACGIADPTGITNELFGGDRANEDIQFKTLRRQFTTQILVPIGLALLHEYENIEKVSNLEPQYRLLTEIIPENLSEKVISFINDSAHHAGAQAFDIRKLRIVIDLNAINRTVEYGTEINRVLEALCEVVYTHNCDMLLLTGRPSKLAGIVSTVKRNLPLPVERIVQMQGFRSGTWYPFHRFGCIGDPKTTAAVGAMLCTISEGGLPNFLFRSDKLNLKSTTRFIGKLTKDSQIPSADVFYGDVKLDDPDYELPPGKSFDFRGAMWLGFRQLPIERWRASLIYVLDYADEESRRRYHPKTPLQVTLKRDIGGVRNGETERFEIAEVQAGDGTSLNRRGLKLQLQTLPDDSGYWLDSGHIKEA